mgnify:CR=1 FL=1
MNLVDREPIRLTDNAMCTADDSKPYCFVDYDGSGTVDLCASTVSISGTQEKRGIS